MEESPRASFVGCFLFFIFPSICQLYVVIAMPNWDSISDCLGTCNAPHWHRLPSLWDKLNGRGVLVSLLVLQNLNVHRRRDVHILFVQMVSL